MHLFVFPRPDQSAVNDFAGFVGQRHRRETLQDEIFALCNGDEFFALQRQETQSDHFILGRIGEASSPVGELALKAIVDCPHEEEFYI
jgi:hypothetical protein